MQGFFGGGLQPGQQSIILDTFPPEKRGAAFGVTAIATVVAPVLGPTLGGFNTDTHDWRWIFFANLPVGMMAVFFVSVLVEDPPWHTKISGHVDDIGLSLIALGFGCLQVMFDRGEDQDWLGSPFIRIMAVLASLGILGAISWLLIAKKPDVNRDVFKDKNFAMGSVCMAATRWASPVHQPFNELIARSERTLTAMGRAVSAVDDIAVGNAYQVFRVQAAVLAYSDVYRLAAVVAFAVVPFCFFLSGKKGCGGAVH